MDERLTFVARLLDGEKMAVLCREFGISRKTESCRNEEQSADDYVFPGREDGTPFGSFPRQWTKL